MKAEARLALPRKIDVRFVNCIPPMSRHQRLRVMNGPLRLNQHIQASPGLGHENDTIRQIV
jgi:hypothetical protein